MTMGQRSFVELFAGGGMARLGLSSGWRCDLACDVDELKAAAYRANWGDHGLVVGDVRDLEIGHLAARPDLVWCSPPCQDLSIAGQRTGLDGGRSGSVWPAVELIKRLAAVGKAPRLVVVENVTGMAASGRGADLTAIITTLTGAGYRVGALAVDARLFVPHSRPRIFIVATASDVHVSAALTSPRPVKPWHPAGVADLVSRLPQADRDRWVWWQLPVPPVRHTDLADLLLSDEQVSWHTPEATSAILQLMSAQAAARLELARKQGRVVGTLSRRMKPAAGGGRAQRADLRIDGVAGCVMVGGGHTLIVADHGGIKTRMLHVREYARLMGLPDTYRLPRGRANALRLIGDGVVVPVVRYLVAELFEPLLDAAAPAASIPVRSGIKGATRSTTLYVLPHELQRLRRLAVDLGVPLHDLLLRGLDRVLADNGQRPLERYR